MSWLLDTATLAEKQMFFYNAARCPYCGKDTNLVDSAIVYNGTSYGLIYFCEVDKAWVGVKSGSDQALGTLANKTLRELRQTARKNFDPLWQKKVDQGFSINKSKRGAYNWLASVLQIDNCEAHLAYLSEEQCHIVINECKKYIPGTEQHKKFQEEYANSHSAEANFQAIEMMAGTTYDVQVILKTYYDLVHHETKQKFRFNIDTSVGKWDRPNEVWKKVDISKFIKKHFLK